MGYDEVEAGGGAGGRSVFDRLIVMAVAMFSARPVVGAKGRGGAQRGQAAFRKRTATARRAEMGPGGVAPGDVAFVLLAGGVGKRMGASMPKQYLPLKGREIALWSLDVISAMDEVGEVVVVCDPSYRDVFENAAEKGWTHGKPLTFAEPGKERMDSVENGLNAVTNGSLVCIHDSARPLVQADYVRRCFADAAAHGAAVLGVKCKATVKQAQPVGEDGVVMVERTLDRSTLWEMNTPQVIEPALLKRGYEHVRREGAEVTDDVSIVEAIGEKVVITEDSYENLKVTTPEDLISAEGILDAREEAAVAA